ncbi:hypothetical protein [Qipengyuania spongiae]|uniref:DUF995 domain-containing protein n=1 Tax=Qipengyuania spongiae TaxID=2909673 RepID=A0ABY5T368_9SPHN|nr:hypothetical protein [Qipengyuania spongiae]UVI39753.1 hypothetical protein L1F33_01960 [Qipengyuania spongiae]
MARLSLPALASIALAACTPQDGATGELAEQAAGTGQVAEPVEADPAELPDEFVRTAWRVVAADGARYTTYFDEGGRYRDFRNGDPWQEGGWETDAEGQLCFLPDPEGGVLRCWQPDRMQDDNRMIATSEGGQRIRIERADYSPPVEPVAEGGDQGNAGDDTE